MAEKNPKIEINKEKLGIVKNQMSHLWNGAFVVGGGGIALLLNDFNTVNIMLGSIGIIVAFIMLNTYFIKHNELLLILNGIEEDK